MAPCFEDRYATILEFKKFRMNFMCLSHSNGMWLTIVSSLGRVLCQILVETSVWRSLIERTLAMEMSVKSFILMPFGSNTTV